MNKTGVTVRWAEAAAVGLTPGRLRGPSWQRATYGVYTPRAPAPLLPETATAVASVMPSRSGFGHLTSAALRGWWLPNGIAGAPVMFASTASRVHVQRQGLYVRRSDYTVVEDVDGLPVVSAPETLLELARDLTLVDLIPLVDCALAGGCDRSSLLASARPRSRGARVLRRAVSLGDPRSESWWESVLRLMHVVTGLGPVECQVELTDEVGFVARSDLHLVGTNRYPECDGGEHRDRDRHEHDLRRDKAMARMGAQRFGYTTSEIARRPETIIRDAEDARGLPHDPARVSRWRHLAATSTLTGHGRGRLNARLARYRRASVR